MFMKLTPVGQRGVVLVPALNDEVARLFVGAVLAVSVDVAPGTEVIKLFMSAIYECPT
jgi:hypothetical protein